MKDYIANIISFVIVILIIVISIIHVYKSRTEEQVDIIDKISETKPEEENIVEEEEILITEEYEIDGKQYEVIATLYIPTLEIQYPVFSTTSKELLKISLNKYWGPNPNRVGNFCILGHNYNDDKFFGKLHNIKLGDYIQLTDMSGKMLQYKVYDTYIVDPDDNNCTSQLTNGNIEITLITCTRNFKQRFIVKAIADLSK